MNRHQSLTQEPDLFTKSIEDRGALELMHNIVSQSSGTGRVEYALNKTHIYTMRLSKMLGIAEEPAFLLSFFIGNLSVDSLGTPLVSLAADIGTSIPDILSLYGHMEFLIDNGYLLVRGPGIYTVPEALLHSLYENRPYEGMGEYGTLFLYTASRDIPKRNLIFDDDLARQTSRLEELLQRDNFTRYQAMMGELGHIRGVCALFHGESGTGKTEFAMQLARLSGRDVMTIDCAHIASKWIGESEKNARAVFASYRKRSSRQESAPILLLNEAESLLSRRTEVLSSGDVDNNRIVNIFLEEMERFEGIMIATCNDISLLDSALSRRFLLKIRFTLPSEEIRTELLIRRLSLSKDVASEIAKKNLTGAQIDNMSRLLTIDRLLGRYDSGTQPQQQEQQQMIYLN